MIKNLKEKSKNLRKLIIMMTNRGYSSHVASGLSCADILVSLYFSVMKIKTKLPNWKYRDRFILSKGHAGAAMYATLSLRGFFKEEILKTHYQNGSKLSGHVSHKGVKGVEFSTGSLGHGLSVSAGYALALKRDKNFKSRVFCLVSDGELNEGSCWEAMLFANHQKLDNLVMIIDRNKLQSIYSTEKTLKIEPLKDKIKSFGWIVRECNGHDHQKIINCIKKKHSSPLCVIANTTKGKGVSFMENNNLWHYKSPQKEFYLKALKELI